MSERDEWTETRPTNGRRALDLEELWNARELVAFLALRDIKVRYKQAVFGGAWAIAQPLAAAAIFTIVFGRLAKLSSGNVPYLVFAFAGLSIWSYFATAVAEAQNSLVSNSALITRVYFPRMALPLASLLPGLVDLAVALVVLAGMCIGYHVIPGFAILTAPVFLFGAIVVAFGAGTLFGTLTVRYRDVNHVFGLLIQLWLFATPVAYPTTLITGRWRWLYALNPMVAVVNGWRWAVIGGPGLGWDALVSALVALLILFVGLRTFQRNERRFADLI